MEKNSGTSADVSEMVQAIDGILFQANLLALHAAVQSAGVGDEFPGFPSAIQAARETLRRLEVTPASSGGEELASAIRGLFAAADRGRSGASGADPHRPPALNPMDTAAGIAALADSLEQGQPASVPEQVKRHRSSQGKKKR